MNAKALLILLALFLVFFSPAGLRAEDDPGGDDPAGEEKKPDEPAPPPDVDLKTIADKLKEADNEGRIKLLDELANAPNAKGEKAAEDAAMKYVTDRDTAVAVAAIRAVGLIGGKGGGRRLMGMAKMKPIEKNPQLFAAVLEALGYYGTPKNKPLMDLLVDTAKKWIPKEPADVAKAACASLGKVPMRQSIEELIKLMELTYPKQGKDSGTISKEYRDRVASIRPSIIGALQELTGWDFEDPKAWENFWASESRRWKPEAKDVDLKSVKVWRDPGYGFSIEKPTDKWYFEKIKDTRIQMKVDVETPDGPLVVAAVYVSAYDTANYPSITQDAKADEREAWYRDNWKDTKEETWVHDYDYRLGKRKMKSAMHAFTGRDRSNNIMKVKNVFILHEGMMFTIGTWTRSGSYEKAQEEIEKALGSFQLTLKGK
jgi:hypothetical protein